MSQAGLRLIGALRWAWRRGYAVLLMSLLSLTGLAAHADGSVAAAGSFDQWLTAEQGRATLDLMGNISPPDGLPGAILAAPSRVNPNYYYHWVRDSGIAIKAVSLLYTASSNSVEKKGLLLILENFIDFSRRTQRTAELTPDGLGEARFTVAGELVPGPWANPQDDGPAIRAIELIHLAFLLVNDGNQELVRTKLYDGALPTDSVIKADLDYIAHHWRQTCYGPWEEEHGHHFYTRVLERKALVEGAMLAIRLGDIDAARAYLDQSEAMRSEITRHWDPQLGYLRATLDRDGGVDYKVLNLDSSVVVATLGGYSIDDLRIEDLYPVEHEQVLATVAVLEERFQALYPINSPGRNIPGIAIGRYPEDRYNGYRSDSLGNPWPCLTLAFAMYYYKVLQAFSASGRIPITSMSLPFFKNLDLRGMKISPSLVIARGDTRFPLLLKALRAKGDSFLERVRYHENADGSLSEEMNRSSGYQQGAPNLTMNYAAFLLAASLRTTVSRELDEYP